MSSILDALKKLESEKEESIADFNWPQSVNTRLTLSGKLTENRMKHRILLGLGATLFMAVSVAYLLAGSGKDDKAATATVEQSTRLTEEAVQKTETLEDAMAFDETVQRPPATEKSLETEKEQAAEEAAVTPDTGTSSGLEALTRLVSRKKSPGLFATQSSAGEKPAADKVAQTAEFNRKASRLIRNLPQDLVPPDKTVPGNWLTLHAISWSSDPSSRIAVINSQIVREGRRIEGGYVKRIDKDYVVIEKDGEDLMLPFGR